MTKPPRTWGKGSKAFTRYENGRLIEEDATIESVDPHVFDGKDETRATPRPSGRRSRVKLAGPSKHEAVISEKHALTIMYGDQSHCTSPEQRLASWAAHMSRRKQAYRQCIARGHHDWRAYEWHDPFRDRTGRLHVCIDCGQYG